MSPLSLGHAMLNRAKTGSRGDVKWASLIVVRGWRRLSHRQGEVLIL